MLWLALRDDQYKHSHFCLVVGPNLDLAKKLIRRMKFILNNDILLEDNLTNTKTEIEVNGVFIQAFPSHNLGAYRSLEDAGFIFLDEADHFERSLEDEVRTVSERNIGKSQPWIVMVSTPYLPNGLMQKIELEENSLYHKIKLGYQVGLGKIYTYADIEEAKKTPSFEQEYNLKYVGRIGNVFNLQSIDNAVKAGELYDLNSINKLSPKYMGIDEGYQSSKFGIVIVEQRKAQMNVLYTEELDKPTYEEAIDRIFELKNRYGNVINIGFDASRPELGRSLKREILENDDWEDVQRVLAECKRNNIHPGTEMIIVPVVFSPQTKIDMTYHIRKMLDDPNNRIAINPTHDKLITSLKAAQFDDRGMMIKNESPHNDLYDAFSIVCNFFQYESDY